jgi:hypothetical protein
MKARTDIRNQQNCDDPAIGDYVPRASIDDEAKKHNGNLPGMGVADLLTLSTISTRTIILASIQP